MLIRITRETADKAQPNLTGGRSRELLPHEIVEGMPIDEFSPPIHGGIKPTFEKECGQTIKQVFGQLVTENILRKSLEKIRAGEYQLTSTLANEIGTTTKGGFAQAEWAGLLFVLECEQSSDAASQKWASGQKVEALKRVGVNSEQAEKLTIRDIKQRLAVTRETLAERKQKSLGVQGRKRGSHRDGTGHR